MKRGLAIRRGFARTLIAAALLPTFLWSSLPAIGCNCSDDSGVSIAFDWLANHKKGQPSYCHCASCASQFGGPCCCCCSKSSEKQEKNDFGLKKNNSCSAVVHGGIVTTSPKLTALDTDDQIGWLQLGSLVLAVNSEVQLQTIEWSTGPPPPIDLVVSLRRLLV